MKIHLVDGTYELFRHFFAVPAAMDVNGQDVGAVRGVLGTVLSMIERGATHIGVATDHVVESFRNDLYVGYKTSEGVPPPLLAQFPILETALLSLGVVVWPMVEFEADDALASAAAKAAAPVAVALALAGIIMGWLSRAATSLPFSALALPVRTLIGVVLLFLSLATLFATLSGVWQAYPWGG